MKEMSESWDQLIQDEMALRAKQKAKFKKDFAKAKKLDPKLTPKKFYARRLLRGKRYRLYWPYCRYQLFFNGLVNSRFLGTLQLRLDGATYLHALADDILKPGDMYRFWFNPFQPYEYVGEYDDEGLIPNRRCCWADQAWIYHRGNKYKPSKKIGTKLTNKIRFILRGIEWVMITLDAR
jgi:hypothetical protein